MLKMGAIFLLSSQPRVPGHSCAQRDAGSSQRDPGPVQTEDGAGSCLTQLRSTQRAVKAHHLHTLLQSIPYSLLTDCVSATHFCFSLSALQGKSQGDRKQRAEKCVFGNNVHIFSFHVGHGTLKCTT